MWFIGVEVEQETSAPPPKKILDLPLRSSPEKREKLAPIPQANYKETGRDTEILE